MMSVHFSMDVFKPSDHLDLSAAVVSVHSRKANFESQPNDSNDDGAQTDLGLCSTMTAGPLFLFHR